MPGPAERGPFLAPVQEGLSLSPSQGGELRDTGHGRDVPKGGPNWVSLSPSQGGDAQDASKRGGTNGAMAAAVDGGSMPFQKRVHASRR